MNSQGIKYGKLRKNNKLRGFQEKGQRLKTAGQARFIVAAEDFHAKKGPGVADDFLHRHSLGRNDDAG